jgi:hypothetical protein
LTFSHPYYLGLDEIYKSFATCSANATGGR